MPTKKKLRTRGIDSLNRQPINTLDARVLAMKRRARSSAMATNDTELPRAVQGDGPQPPPNAPLPMLSDDEDDVPMHSFDEPLVNAHEDPAADPPVPGLDDLGAGLNDGFYSGRRQHEESQWRTRYPAMFPAFLKGQQKTRDWSNPETFNIDFKAACNCTGSPRTLDVLDLMGQFWASYHC